MYIVNRVVIDITNVCGSVHLSLIQFALAHYYALPVFTTYMLQFWYMGLLEKIFTKTWEIRTIPHSSDRGESCQFLECSNFHRSRESIVQHPHTEEDLGFSLPNSSLNINHLLFADSMRVVCCYSAAWQHCLHVDLFQSWLQWSVL